MTTKRVLIAQSLILVVVMGIGMSLTNQLTEGNKQVHALLGLLAGVLAAASTYLAYKEEASRDVRLLAAAAVVLTFLAGVGGKIGETNYATGLLLMRITAVLALAASLGGLYGLRKKR